MSTTTRVLVVAHRTAATPALLEAVPLAYEVVRYAGAAFLIYLGVRALFSREAPTAGPVVARDSLGRPTSRPPEAIPSHAVVQRWLSSRRHSSALACSRPTYRSGRWTQTLPSPVPARGSSTASWRPSPERMLTARRNILTSSSCGLCGRVTIDSLKQHAAPLAVEPLLCTV